MRLTGALRADGRSFKICEAEKGIRKFGVRQTLLFVCVLFVYVLAVTLLFSFSFFLLMLCCLLEGIFHQSWNFSWLAWRHHPVLTGEGWLSAAHTCVTFWLDSAIHLYLVCTVKNRKVFFLFWNSICIMFQGFQYLCHMGTKSWKTLWWRATQETTEEHWCLSRGLNVSGVAPILPHEFFQEIGDSMYCTT